MRTIEKKNEQENEVKQIPLSTAIFEDSLVEQVWSEGKPAFQIHKHKGSETDLIVDVIEAKDAFGRLVKYVPMDNEHLRKGSVIIPECNKEIESAKFSHLWELQDKLLNIAFDAVKQKQDAQLRMRICTSSWFIDKEETGIAGVGKFAPIIPIRGLSGGGKNRFMTVLRFCSYHPFYQSSTNKIPSIYRPLELWKGVLALNECDIDIKKDRDLVGFLLARSYGDPISRQNPNNISEANAFNQFQVTLCTQREGFGENALEGRSLPFYTEKSWEKLPTLETPEMVELGEEIQKLSLALRMKYWREIEINKAMWLDTSDARLNASLLPLRAIGNYDDSVVSLIDNLLKKLERRKIQLKAESDDGVLINYLYEKIDPRDSALPLFESYRDGKAFYFLAKHEIKADRHKNEKTGEILEVEEEVKIPLTTSQMVYDLGWSSAKAIRSKLDGLLHTEDLPETMRIDGKKVRPVFFHPGPLVKLFREFVLDFDVEKGLPLELRPKENILDGTDGTDGTDLQSLESVCAKCGVKIETLPIFEDGKKFHQGCLIGSDNPDHG